MLKFFDFIDFVNLKLKNVRLDADIDSDQAVSLASTRLFRVPRPGRAFFVYHGGHGTLFSLLPCTEDTEPIRPPLPKQATETSSY